MKQSIITEICASYWFIYTFYMFPFEANSDTVLTNLEFRKENKIKHKEVLLSADLFITS